MARECKRCHTVRGDEQFADQGTVCHFCKEEARFRREERAVLAKLDYFRKQIKAVRRAHVRRVAKLNSLVCDA
jgi:hypothetical protein